MSKKDRSIFSTSELNQLYILEGIIKRVANSTYNNGLVLRGGMMSRHWYASGKWMPSDIDYMVAEVVPSGEMEDIWEDIFLMETVEDGIYFDLETFQSEVIWADIEVPALRLFIDASIGSLGEPITVHIDISYADPFVPEAIFDTYPSVLFGAIENVKMVHKETSAGWKFYALFEYKENKWRPKDLFGLYWLITRYQLNLKWVMDSYKETCIKRGTPFQIAARFFENEFGQSSKSKRIWRAFCKAHPSFDLPENVREVIELVQQTLQDYYVQIINEHGKIVTVSERGFPVIERIEEVLVAIKERHEFEVYYRDKYRIVDYKRPIKYSFIPVTKAMHPSVAGVYALRRECRGLIFDAEGRLIHRKMHKFFNIGELKETEIDNIDWSKPCRVLEKLDGSLVAPVMWEGELKWATRKGLSRIAEQAGVFAEQYTQNLSKQNNKTGYIPMVMDLMKKGWTPCFEWCSRQHPIVLDYEESQLVLTTVRNNKTGHYLSYEKMETLALEFQVPCIQTKGEISTKEDAQRFIKWAENEVIGEGYVLRFRDDRFYKVKNKWYVKLHRLVAHANNEIYVWQAVLNKELAEMLACVSPFLRPEIELLSEELNQEILKVVQWVEQFVKTASTDARIVEKENWDEKDKVFSLVYVKPLNSVRQKLAYLVWHRYKRGLPVDINEIVRGFFLRHCQNNRRLRKVKETLGIL